MGKVKEIREKKIPFELKDVFTSCKEVRKVVLVEGIAGAGKSSMVINACREWGMGNIFKGFKRCNTCSTVTTAACSVYAGAYHHWA